MNFSFPTTMKSARLVRRYKRFLADVVFDDGLELTAHCPNPGRMTTCMGENTKVWLSLSDNPKRKLKWTWELSEINGVFVLVNTQRANLVVGDALSKFQIAPLSMYQKIRAEQVIHEGSRADFLLEDPEDDQPAKCWVEVKNVTLNRSNGVAAFPDAVSARGRKHLDVLANKALSGDRAVLLYHIGRQDCSTVVPAADIDPKYAQAVVSAHQAGVEFYALRTQISVEGVAITSFSRLSPEV